MKKTLALLLLCVFMITPLTSLNAEATSGAELQESDNPLLEYLKNCSDRNQTPSIDDYMMFLESMNIDVGHIQRQEVKTIQLDVPNIAGKSQVDVRPTLIGPMQQTDVHIQTQQWPYLTLAGKLMLATASVYWPIVSFVDALVGSIPFPTTVYGNVVATTYNSYTRYDMWYEIVNQYGQWEPFVITQWRQTNLSFAEKVTRSVSPYDDQFAFSSFTGFRFQTSNRWGDHLANEAEAIDRYYRGWGLQVYTYNGIGSTDILNTHMLP
ncbi:MAG: hypothetical protein FD169_1364 [Bacillota bacterium]|nr:MAG: hypothetical protein FD169_1364 [Bacillota bacterium]